MCFVHLQKPKGVKNFSRVLLRVQLISGHQQFGSPSCARTRQQGNSNKGLGEFKERVRNLWGTFLVGSRLVHLLINPMYRTCKNMFFRMFGALMTHLYEFSSIRKNWFPPNSRNQNMYVSEFRHGFHWTKSIHPKLKLVGLVVDVFLPPIWKMENSSNWITFSREVKKSTANSFHRTSNRLETKTANRRKALDGFFQWSRSPGFKHGIFLFGFSF